MIWKEVIEKHTYIEFRMRKNPSSDSILTEGKFKNLLWEEHGIIPNLDCYIDCIMKKIDNFIGSWNLNKKKLMELTITRDDFNFNTFFDEFEMLVSLILVPNIEEYDISGGYSSPKSGWLKGEEGKEYYKVTIPYIKGKGNPYKVRTELRIALAHEITHAYDDYCRKNNSADTIEIQGRKRGQFIATKVFSDFNRLIERRMAFLVYFLNNVEINAYLGQLKEEMKPYISTIRNSKDATTLITRTMAYKRLMLADGIYKELLFAYNEIYTNPQYDEFRKQSLEAFNKTRRKTESDKKKGITKDTPVSSYSKMMSILKKKHNYLISNFWRKAGKIVYDLFEEENDTVTDYGFEL